MTTNNEVDALLLEQNLIKSEKPRFNILLRDDKSYPFIHLDESHAYPRIASKRVLKGHDGLYGPYTSAYATRIAVNQIQKVFLWNGFQIIIKGIIFGNILRLIP